MCVKMVVSLGQRGRYTKSASGELDVRRRDLGPALAAVRVAHDLDLLPAELHAVVALLLAAQERQRQRSNLTARYLTYLQREKVLKRSRTLD